MIDTSIRRMAALPVCAGLFMLFCAAGWQDMLRGLPEKAEREYRQENYEQALQLYQEAQTRNPDSDTLAYNLGNTLYQLGRYQDAAGQFGRILQQDSTSLSPRAIYNMGNSLFKMGQESGNQEFLSKALEAFKQSIISDPADEDAKYNFELTKRLIQQQEQQQQQDRQDKDENRDQQDQQQNQQDKQQDRQQQDPQQQQQEQQQPRQQAGEDRQEQQPPPGEMSEEEAEKILQALMQMEQEAREEQEKKKKSQATGSKGRDW
ncbi:MAG: tetratricopeptide repeat protein [Candidatus Glassbacteria bacterium]|nr:tetratricopeptide repeat protein [Candidatus Glassbacteria bacterium]